MNNSAQIQALQAQITHLSDELFAQKVMLIALMTCMGASTVIGMDRLIAQTLSEAQQVARTLGEIHAGALDGNIARITSNLEQIVECVRRADWFDDRTPPAPQPPRLVV